MKAMILAAGRGTRLEEVTQHTPKPLVMVQGKRLIEYRLEALAKAGIKEVVINTHYLAEQFEPALGRGEAYGLKIHYAYEETLLDTGGGIKQALQYLGEQPFLLTNSDLMTNFSYRHLVKLSPQWAHLVMVDKPVRAKQGDFDLCEGVLSPATENALTYSGIAVIHPKLLFETDRDVFPLVDVLRPKISQGLITAEYYQSAWADVGIKEELNHYVN